VKREDELFVRRLGSTFHNALRRRGWRINRYDSGMTTWTHPNGFECEYWLLRDVFILLAGARSN
jgi:hypothetical protein